MIIAALFIVTVSGETPALRSRQTFPTLAACEAWLEAERPATAALARDLSARTGRPVTLRARCLDLRPAA